MTQNAWTRRKRALLLACFLLLPLAFLDWGAIYSTVAYHPAEKYLGLDVRFARAAWLPGPRVSIPSQPCPSCARNEHDACAQQTQRLDLISGIAPAASPPRSLTLSVSGSVEASGIAGGGQRILCDSFVLEGVIVEPASFHCPCCPR